MGTVLDTTVFVDIERATRREKDDAPAQVGRHLVELLGADEEAAIAAITASELLHGVHRARAENRPLREAFVESVLSAVPVLPFDLLAARAHARLWAELSLGGSDIGAHGRLIAATAISIGWRVATANVMHFERVTGLEVVAVR